MPKRKRYVRIEKKKDGMTVRERLTTEPDIIQDVHNSAACMKLKSVNRINLAGDDNELGPIPDTRNVEKIYENIEKYVRPDQQKPLKDEMKAECLDLGKLGLGKVVREDEIDFSDEEVQVMPVSVVITQKNRPQTDGTKKMGWKSRIAAAGHPS